MGLAGQALDPSSEMQVFSLNPLGILFFLLPIYDHCLFIRQTITIVAFSKGSSAGTVFKCAMTVVGLMGRPQEIS